MKASQILTRPGMANPKALPLTAASRQPADFNSWAGIAAAPALGIKRPAAGYISRGRFGKELAARSTTVCLLAAIGPKGATPTVFAQNRLAHRSRPRHEVCDDATFSGGL